jgi:hypothetical protein
MPPTEQGLSHVGGDEVDAPRAPESGESKILDSRTTPLRGGGGK